MRAAVLYEVGTIPVFADFKEPEPDDTHRVLEVLLAALNPIDLFMAAGLYGEVELPRVVGLEGIARLDGGERVYFQGTPAPFGSMAQYAPIAVDQTFAVPEGLEAGLAVSLGIAGLAAWLSLTWRAHLRPGESVLVLGASGVVGQIAIQAAKLLGAAHVVAAARHQPTLERLRERRAADAIVVLRGDDDERALRDAAGDGGYDVVIDPIYGPPLQAALRATAAGARIVSFGASAGQVVELALGDLIGRTLIGHTTGQAPFDVRRQAYGDLAVHAAAGEIAVDVERLPLSEIEQAWQHQAESPHRKVTIVP